MVDGSPFKTTCSVTWEGTFSKDKNGSWPMVPNCATAVDLLHSQRPWSNFFINQEHG